MSLLPSDALGVSALPNNPQSYEDYAAFFSAIDLSTLTPPAIIEQLAYSDIFSDVMNDFLDRDPEYETLLESDPAVKVLETVSYREQITRQKFNERAQQLLLAYANGTNLDHLGAFYSVYREVVSPANPYTTPPTPAVYESDTAFRRRIQLAPESFSCAGPAGAYLFHTYSAHVGVSNAVVYNNASGLVKPGVVLVVIRVADGYDPLEVTEAVRKRLFRPDIKPLTDQVQIKVATPANYAIKATVYVLGGPDAGVSRAQLRSRLALYLSLRGKIGSLIPRSGLFGAFQGEYVERVDMPLPAEDFQPGLTEYPFLNALNLTVTHV